MNINWGDSLIFKQSHIRKSQLQNRFLVIFLSNLNPCAKLVVHWKCIEWQNDQIWNSWLVVEPSLWKKISELGLLFPYIMENKSVPNHQPDRYSWQCHLCTAYRAYHVISFGRTKLRKLLLQHHRGVLERFGSSRNWCPLGFQLAEEKELPRLRIGQDLQQKVAAI